MTGKILDNGLDDAFSDVDITSAFEEDLRPSERLGKQMEALASKDSEDFSPEDFDDKTITIPKPATDDKQEQSDGEKEKRMTDATKAKTKVMPKDLVDIAMERLMTGPDTGRFKEADSEDVERHTSDFEVKDSSARKKTLTQKVYDTVKQISFVKGIFAKKSEETQLKEQHKKLEKQLVDEIKTASSQYEWALGRIHHTILHTTKYAPKFVDTERPEYLKGKQLEFLVTYYRPLPDRPHKAYKLKCNLYDEKVFADVTLFKDNDLQKEEKVGLSQQLFMIEVEQPDSTTPEGNGTRRMTQPGKKSKTYLEAMKEHISRLDIKVSSYQYKLNRQSMEEFLKDIAGREDIDEEERQVLSYSLRQLFAVDMHITNERLDEIRSQGNNSKAELERMMKLYKLHIETFGRMNKLDI